MEKMEIFFRLLWPEYMRLGNQHSLRVVMKYFFIQKILRINSHVPWPVHPTSNIICPENIYRGTRTPGMSISCHIDGRNGIILGKNVWVGPRVSIISMNHNVNNYKKYVKTTPIIIGDNCWLAAGSTVLPGVVLGEHTVLAAGTVVTKSFPEGDQILGGIPARQIKKLSNYNE